MKVIDTEIKRKSIIGGEFKITASALSVEYNSISPMLSLGRTCLYSILSSLNIKTILIPDYVCQSVAEVPVRLNINLEHFHINKNLLPDMDSIDSRMKTIEKNKKTAILFISYFGVVDIDDVITDFRHDYPEVCIIVDDVQNYYGFGQHKDFDYCFNSYRKWFPVPDGADIIEHSKNLIDIFDIQPDYVLYKCAGNILKSFSDIVGDDFCLQLIEYGERMMDKEYTFSVSEISKKLIRCVDVDYAEKRRRGNAEYLHNGLNRIGIDHLYCSQMIPLCIPIFVNNRDNLRKQFFEQKIFSPVHWPLVNEGLQGRNCLYEKELSLICDQRYDEEDMERILRGIEDVI